MNAALQNFLNEVTDCCVPTDSTWVTSHTRPVRVRECLQRGEPPPRVQASVFASLALAAKIPPCSSDEEAYAMLLPTTSELPSSPRLQEADPQANSYSSAQPSEDPCLRVQEAYSSIRLGLGGMALLNAVSLGVLWMAQAQWAALMDTAGFVDSPALTYTNVLTSCCVFSIVIFAVFMLTMPQRVPLHHPLKMQRFNSAGTLIMGVALLNMILCISWIRIPEDTALQLIGQADAIANFNRGYCHAWCRQADDSLVLLARGACGPLESTVFDEVVSAFDVASWCQQAIDNQNYALVADYQGSTPFASLKGETAQSLIHTHTERLRLVALFSFVICIVMVDHIRNFGRLSARKND